MEKRLLPQYPAIKCDDRLEDTQSPNHKSKKIQRGDALVEAVEQAKDDHRYADVEDRNEKVPKTDGMKGEMALITEVTQTSESHESNPGANNHNADNEVNSMISDKGSKNLENGIRDEAPGTVKVKHLVMKEKEETQEQKEDEIKEQDNEASKDDGNNNDNKLPTIIVELPQISVLTAETKEEAKDNEGYGLGIVTDSNHENQEVPPAEAIIQEHSSISGSSEYSQVSRTLLEKADEERKKKMEILSAKAKLNKKARRKRAKLQKKEELAQRREKEVAEMFNSRHETLTLTKGSITKRLLKCCSPKK